MAEQIKIILPEAVKKIINVLQSAGYEAWAVGGCVRDSILHREPDDWDITAIPLQRLRGFWEVQQARSALLRA